MGELWNIGTEEHRSGEHRYGGTSVPGYIGSANTGSEEHRYRGTYVRENIGLANMGT